jgi:hypothetical protein
MNYKIELLNVGLMVALTEKKNTLLSVKHFNEKLWELHNKIVGMRYRISYKQFETDIIGTYKYEELKEKYLEMLSEKVGFKVKSTMLEASSPGTVDCILFEEDR